MRRYVRSFFFSSRRRHTILTCDWSSDVCSSDLSRCCDRTLCAPRWPSTSPSGRPPSRARGPASSRSEERRVGKECRCIRHLHDTNQENSTVRVHALHILLLLISFWSLAEEPVRC